MLFFLSFLRLTFPRGHFPRLAECAHFHYETADFGNIQVSPKNPLYLAAVTVFSNHIVGLGSVGLVKCSANASVFKRNAVVKSISLFVGHCVFLLQASCFRFVIVSEQSIKYLLHFLNRHDFIVTAFISPIHFKAIIHLQQSVNPSYYSILV